MVKFLKKVAASKTVLMFGIFVMWSAVMMFPVHADTPVLVSGTLKLVAAATGWLTGLIPVTAALLLMWHSYMKGLAEGESSEVAARNKSMKRVMVTGAIATGASGLTTIILAFYQ